VQLSASAFFTSIILVANVLIHGCFSTNHYCCLIQLSSCRGILVRGILRKLSLSLDPISLWAMISMLSCDLHSSAALFKQRLSPGRCSMRCPDSKLCASFTRLAAMLACSLCFVSMILYCIVLKLHAHMTAHCSQALSCSMRSSIPFMVLI